MNILIELVDNNELCLTKNDKINLATTYGLIQESILKSINLFIYTIENIQIVLLDGIKKIIGDKDCLFKDSFSFDKNTIKKFLVLKRFRDENGNVLPNELTSKYTSYIQLVEDEKIAAEMQYDYTYRRYNGMDPRTSHVSQYGQMSNLISRIIRQPMPPVAPMLPVASMPPVAPSQNIEELVSSNGSEIVEDGIADILTNDNSTNTQNTTPYSTNQVNNFYNNFNINNTNSINNRTRESLYDLVFSTMVNDLNDNSVNEINLDVNYSNNSTVPSEHDDEYDPESNSTDQEQPPISPISMQNTSSVTTNFTPPPRSSAPVFNNMPISSLTAENLLNVIENMITQRVPVQQNLVDVKIVCTDEEFNNLTVMKYSDLKKLNSNKVELVDTCPITLEDFTDDSDIIVLPCNHCIGISGGKKWLKEVSNKCPICRKKCSTGHPI
mgnify:CR=1 FL=1|tara:strand:+ start:347 stop:1663 length:1317 start_codon:yes stop_codon:yes gene_type:complete